MEISPNDEEFVDYNANDFNIKFVNLNIRTFETNDLFNLRIKGETTIRELRKKIATKLNCDENLIRMALEKTHSLYNYIYLNKNFEETLHSQHFGRVNKVFIEYKDETDLNKQFESSKFCYALDAIINMLQTVVYLPSDENCDIFLRKIKRHTIYMDNLNKKQKIQQQDYDETPSKLTTEENTTDIYSYEAANSVQSTSNTLENENNENNYSSANNKSLFVSAGAGDEASFSGDVRITTGLEEASNIDLNDSASRMSIQIEDSNQNTWVILK